MEPVAKPSFANLFFHLFDPAKFDSRGASRFRWRHARTNVFRYQKFKVRMNFLVEVCVHTPWREKVSQKTSNFQIERHAQNLSTMFPKLGR